MRYQILDIEKTDATTNFPIAIFMQCWFRYVDILTAPIGTYPENSLMMSPKQCGGCCFWGARGTMVDNSPLVSYFNDNKTELVKCSERGNSWIDTT